MGPESRNLLEENLKLVKENNRLLRKLKRAQTIGTIFKLIWIAVLVGVPFIFYVYVLQPYYMSLQEGIGEFRGQIGDVPGLNIFLDLLEKTTPRE